MKIQSLTTNDVISKGKYVLRFSNQISFILLSLPIRDVVPWIDSMCQLKGDFLCDEEDRS